MGVRDEPWTRAAAHRVRLVAPICVKYGHPDLSKTHEYLIDFGLVKVKDEVEDGRKTVYYRGFGAQPVAYIAVEIAEPKFLGAYFQAASEKDLENALKVPGASTKIENFLDGKMVTIIDPTGVPFHVVHGLTPREFTPRENEIEPQNYPATSDRDSVAKPRRGKFHRLTKNQPIPVHKLGHVGYIENSIDEACEFYCTHFNLKPSDIILGPDNSILLIFLHFDLGQEYTDHHSFFLVQTFAGLKAGNAHHAAFEVESIDTQFVGHDYLESKGYKLFWGVGRHIEGSQVFDYWFDLDGFLVEHYADGDLVNEDHPISYVPHRNALEGSNWGPPPQMAALG